LRGSTPLIIATMQLIESLPVKLYGQGEAKTIEHLLEEIESGECLIQWQAYHPVRVINVVVANVFTLDAKQYLIEEKQVFSDGRVRQRQEKDGSPKRGISEKMQPKEVSQDAVLRAVEEELGIDPDYVRTACLGMNAEESESPSYPGLLTRYVRHKYDVFIEPEAYKAEGYVEVQDDKTTYFVWRKVPMKNIELVASDRGDFTLLEIGLPNEVCEPADLKGLELPNCDTTKGIVLSGRAPVWLFACLAHQAHIYKWVGTFDPRLEVDGVKGAAVVVESHGGNYRAGDVIPVPKQ